MSGIIEIETQVARLQAGRLLIKSSQLSEVWISIGSQNDFVPISSSSLYLISCFTTSPIPLFFLF